VLACIGEQFDEGDEVCGVTVNIRQGKDRIELWTKTAANEVRACVCVRARMLARVRVRVRVRGAWRSMSCAVVLVAEPCALRAPLAPPRRARVLRACVHPYTLNQQQALQMSIGKQLKQLLDIPESIKIGFIVFVSAAARRGARGGGACMLRGLGARAHRARAAAAPRRATPPPAL
jgi:hypothetical protein